MWGCSFTALLVDISNIVGGIIKIGGAIRLRHFIFVRFHENLLHNMLAVIVLN